MKEYSITVDVYANWRDTQPVYRIYVDNELLAEHDFTWNGNEVYIREHIQAILAPGAHNVRIEHINSSGTIKVKNITLDGVEVEDNFITE
jgi:hypothetical protein